MYPAPVEKLIRLFSHFPTIGPRTATRFAFHCLGASKEEIYDLIDALKEVKESVGMCNVCFRSISKDLELCSVCSNKKRNHSILCVVEKETDLLSIEKTNEYDGLYFILDGTVSPLKKENIKKIRIKELKERIEKHNDFDLPKIKEVIIATNQNTEGEATAIYLTRVLNELKVKTTRLGRGLSTGGELEYADEETLTFALKGRK
jgi:recombination protein RecR